MTTERATRLADYTTTSVGAVVRAAFLVTLLVGLLAVLLAAFVSGSSAALGAGIGTAMVCLFFGLGALALNVVSTIAPSASLMVAMLTYTLKVVLLGLVFAGLSRSGALDGDVDARWLSGTVIVCTLVWLVTQVARTMRARQLVYDLPSVTAEANAR